MKFKLQVNRPSLEECPRRYNAAQQEVGNADCSALDDGQRPRIDSWCRDHNLVCPDDGLDELLPITTAGEQEHQTISRTWRAVRLDDL